MAVATFRFYGGLNAFLAPERRGRGFTCLCAQAATTKHMIEALGVPHTEVELVLVDGESVGFDRRIADGDRVAVYPKFEALDVGSLSRVRDRSLPATRFVADAHLGGLAHLLRMMGFDTLYENEIPDDRIEQISRTEGRVVLTRDRELLKRRGIVQGCYVHALHPERQLREIVDRFDLARAARPFTRCLRCNSELRAVEKARVASRLPPNVLARHDQFTVCDHCGRIFWKGSHWQRMQDLLDTLAPPQKDGGAAPGDGLAKRDP